MMRALLVLPVALLLAGCAGSSGAAPTRSTPASRLPAAPARPSPGAQAQAPATLPTSSIPVRAQQLALSGALSDQIGSAEVFRCGASSDQVFYLSLSSIQLGRRNVSISIAAGGYHPGSRIPLNHAQGMILEYGPDQQAHFYDLAGGTLTIQGNGERGSIDAEFHGVESAFAGIHLSGTWSCV